MEISLNVNKIANFISNKEDKNSLYDLENFLRNLLPLEITTRCQLFASLTSSGNLLLVLEALNAGNHEMCSDALVSLGETLHEHSSDPQIARSLFNPGSWLKDKVVDVQDTIIDAPQDIWDYLDTKVDEGLLNAEDYADRVSGAEQAYVQISTLVMAPILAVTNTVGISITIAAYD